MNFDANAPGKQNLNIFGLPCNIENSKIILIPVRWDATTSFSRGTADGVNKLIDASFQVDLYDTLNTNAWKKGIALAENLKPWKNQNKIYSTKTKKYIDEYCLDEEITLKKYETFLKDFNLLCNKLNNEIYNSSLNFLKENKIVGLIGGEHSISFGNIKAIAEKYNSIGILQIDAHFDLRKNYENFEHSHASVMFNCFNKIKEVSKIVSVGIRDFCEWEYNLVKENPIKLKTFLDKDIHFDIYNGKTWHNITTEIINELPENVYISFDIDGLTPSNCPNTGTPVPGGLQFNQALYLIHQLSKSNKKIVGFDLVEVGNNKLDAIIGAQLLYKICVAVIHNNT